jgi:hypothetical protein
VERKYLECLIDSVPLRDWREIVRRAVTDAKAGEHQARSWLSKHLIGDDFVLVDLIDELREKLEALDRGQGNARATGAGAAGEGAGGAGPDLD